MDGRFGTRGGRSGMPVSEFEPPAACSLPLAGTSTPSTRLGPVFAAFGGPGFSNGVESKVTHTPWRSGWPSGVCGIVHGFAAPAVFGCGDWGWPAANEVSATAINARSHLKLRLMPTSLLEP